MSLVKRNNSTSQVEIYLLLTPVFSGTEAVHKVKFSGTAFTGVVFTILVVCTESKEDLMEGVK